MAILDQHLQRVAQGRLVGKQQADRAQVAQLALFGHAQAEGLAAAVHGRILQQFHCRRHWNGVFRILKHGLGQADGGQFRLGIQSQVQCYFQVVGQYACANKMGHARNVIEAEAIPGL